MTTSTKTDWFPGTITPVRKGVYERRKLDNFVWIKFFSYWDGKQWYMGNRTPHLALLEFKVSNIMPGKFGWRGLLA